jgi:hypothetical protein
MAESTGRRESLTHAATIQDSEELMARVRLIGLPTPPMVGPAERAKLDAIRELRRVATAAKSVRMICRSSS